MKVEESVLLKSKINPNLPKTCPIWYLITGITLKRPSYYREYEKRIQRDIKMDLGLLKELVKEIEQIKSIMIAISTGGPTIQSKEKEYKELYLSIEEKVESLNELGLSLSHSNSFRSLWDWYGYWSSGDLPKYQLRRQYIQELYANLLYPIQTALHKHKIKRTPTSNLIDDIKKRINDSAKDSSPTFTFTLKLLHPKIIERCETLFETGKYENAIFDAMKVIEEEVRNKIGANPDDVGITLISKAMSPNNPRIILSEVSAEQEASHSLYRGAIGFYKNPSSHRFTDIDDPLRTFEILAFASLLMRMLNEC